MKTTFEFGPDETEERDDLLRLQRRMPDLADLYQEIRLYLKYGPVDGKTALELLEEAKAVLAQAVLPD